MQPKKPIVEPLKEIRLSIQTSVGKSDGKFVQPPFETAFIVGLAPDGMCPFEYQLLNKTIGAKFIFQLNRNEISGTFGYIEIPMELFPDNVDAFYVTVVVLDVSVVTPREIVRSMADISKRGGGCCDHC